MNIYFSGIGGVGIGPLAEIARDAGHTISGSDREESLMTSELRSQGATITTVQDGSFLEQQHEKVPIDWFVYTAALPADHPELILAQKLGIHTAKRDELLARIISESGQKLIAIAGTHGKTTTTGMLVWAFEQLDIPVSYSVGTTLSFGPSGKFDPDSQYFIYECDEFDRNFLHFTPHLSIITSVDYDHPDTYPTEEEYKSAFRQFIYQSEQAVLWQDNADYLKSRYSQQWNLQPDEVLPLSFNGEHNRRNGTLALKALERLHIGENKLNRFAVESFPGTGRRFEKLADNLYTDYGHHPVEIAATLQMAHELSPCVVLVYQPHQNVRQYEVKDAYMDNVFAHASEIYWLPTYLSRENPNLAILSPKDLTKRLSDTKPVHVAALDDHLWQDIQNHLQSGHLVLAMGAGTIDGWLRKQLH